MKKIIIACSLLVLNALAFGSDTVECGLSIKDFTKKIGQNVLFTSKVTIDFGQAKIQSNAVKAMVGNQEVLFKLDALNNRGEKHLALQVYNSYASGASTVFKEQLKGLLADTSVALGSSISEDSSAFLDVKVPDTEGVIASINCMGLN